MNMSLLFQLMVYELLDIIPCSLLAAAPLRHEPHVRGHTAAAAAVLYILGIGRRLMVAAHPATGAPLSVLWIVLYVLAFLLVYRVPLSKSLFVLLTVLNFASLVAILYSFLGDKLFGSRFSSAPYGMEACLSLALVWAVFFPPCHYFMAHRLATLISLRTTDGSWRFLWLVPATFCVFFYYNLLTAGGYLHFSADTRNFAFAMVISAGFCFVLSLVLRLVWENDTVLTLKQENYQLSLQALQYENLQSRIEETRRARHDLRQSMAAIQAFLQSDDREALKQYTARYCETLPADEPLLFCREPAVNAVLSYYARSAAEQGIPFETKVEHPESACIPDTDMVVLLGNLLENAVEACKRQAGPERFIRLAIRLEGGALIIVMDNSYTGEPLSDSDTLRSSKSDRLGIGSASVRQIAAKYHGVAKLWGDGTQFHASVCLPLTGRLK